ncbi:phenylalanine--tRNA ligase subunit alpha [Patescibacteria group bacterium]|nr:phenylalanine--tRNA ligase subunit alpha [Patescibacteria group bacterium]MBU0777081.1 phenylalanine--tRNA ligase subunit alpha [Patescibacteria group bacterium]MBU0845775.1 phenylalanine--tRNA ligase subunit alpha [Patescibacteria group bacterium]MBU0922802.1 phenylalanine--tRNA ligase subunit alpha [Patescibacteria group bacterium]MBU1066465.1 phenylalanine--tRNA ligase subunit alpha [Patescibacteria group bacterium]
MQKGIENINKFTSIMLDVKNEALAQIVDAGNINELEELKIAYLGRNGKLTTLIKKIKDLSISEKKQAGGLINEVKNTILDALATQKNTLKESARDWFDASIPGKKPTIGHLHLITQAIREISSTFEKIGFVRVRYPEVEWDWYAFESLNIPRDHPARDDWETFFIDTPPHSKYGLMVLTPHTSSGQVREMMRVKKPPIRMLNIAKNYRRQSDVSHVPMFHQFEGLVIDEGISVAHLKGTLDYFARNFFGKDRKTRLRPHHFQFTEPSFEVDISCGVCKGNGCKLCKEGWLELGGAGMVHPNVLKNGKIDPNKYTGFAFGWGVERTFMMKAGLEIGDIRLLYSPDLKFLRQF